MSKHSDLSPDRVRIEQNTCKEGDTPFEVTLCMLAVLVVVGVELPLLGLEMGMIWWNVGQVWSWRCSS